jgi:[ribosomal protein S5]-alanine N-acetyltransferase
MEIIETQRLLLRPFVAADEEMFVAQMMSSDFMQYSRAGPLSEVAARENFKRRLALSCNQFAKLALIEKSSGRHIGYCGVDTCELEGKPELELGYRLIKNTRGRGYATEAARAVLDYYQRQGVVEIIAFTAHGNNPLQAVLKKLGYKFVKTSEIESFPIVVFRR